MTCSPEARKQVWVLTCRQRPRDTVTIANMAMPVEIHIQLAGNQSIKLFTFFILCWYPLNLLCLFLYSCRSVFHIRAINNLCMLIACDFGGSWCTLRRILASPAHLHSSLVPLLNWALLFKTLIALKVLPELCGISFLYKHLCLQISHRKLISV